MKASLSLLLALVLTLSASSRHMTDAAQSPSLAVVGSWEGAILISGQSLGIRVVFAGGADGLRATIDIPLQRTTAASLNAVRADGGAVHFELPAGSGLAVFDGTLEGERIAGTFAQGPAKGTFALTRSPEPPPYREEEVAVMSGSVTLAGTLSIPLGAGPFPAVVMITGSGPQDRDEDVAGFKLFRTIADHLTRNGVAVYRYDDRGVGRSTGSFATATTMDSADDALAAIAALKRRPDIDGRHVGALGHSDGSTAAAIAAARSPDVAFAVMLAGPGVRGDDVLRQQAIDYARAGGADAAAVERIAAAHRKATNAIRAGAPTADLAAAVRELVGSQYDGLPAAQRAALGARDAFVEQGYRAGVAQLSSPWMKSALAFDPVPTLRQVRCPALALFGSLDTQVPPSLNEPPVRGALSTNAAATVKVYPGANHLFQSARTGLAMEYASLAKAFTPGLLDELSSWIRRVTA